MTDKERKDLAATYEKQWFRSKKFIAFLIMEVVFCAMAMVALFTQRDLGWPLAAFMTGIVVAMGFLALAFNGKQAQLDMYVRAMALTGGVPKKLNGDLEVHVDGRKLVPPDPALESTMVCGGEDGEL